VFKYTILDLFCLADEAASPINHSFQSLFSSKKYLRSASAFENYLSALLQLLVQVFIWNALVVQHFIVFISSPYLTAFLRMKRSVL